MPKRPLKECAKQGCSKLVRGERFCATHAAVHKKLRAKKAPDPFYKRKRWQLVRSRFLRGNPLCSRCGRPATTVHHIKEIKDGGAKLDFENLEALCASCHSRHHGWGKSEKRQSV